MAKMIKFELELFPTSHFALVVAKVHLLLPQTLNILFNGFSLPWQHYNKHLNAQRANGFCKFAFHYSLYLCLCVNVKVLNFVSFTYDYKVNPFSCLYLGGVIWPTRKVEV